MFRREGNALSLAGFDSERVQPERFPAVVEPVQQPEMVTVEMEDGGGGSAVGERQHHGTAGLGLAVSRMMRCSVAGDGSATMFIPTNAGTALGRSAMCAP